MTTQRENGPALIIIDVQEGFNDPRWGKRSNPQLEENIAQLLRHWREKNRSIFHVQHLSRNPKSPLSPAHPGVQFMACAKPMDGEPVIQKQVNSCFIGTNLEERLRAAQITDLVFVGIASDHCASTSTRMAANLGFRCTIVADATTSFDRTDHHGRTYPGELVHSVNLASLHGEFATVVDTSTLLNPE